MTLTYGFYNSLSGDRKYNATDFGNLFNGILTDGVFLNAGGHLVVSQQTGSNMNVLVADGRAWFNGTWTYNSSPLAVTVDASEAVLNRYDAVILEVDSSTPVRANSIKMVKGTPASSPAYPTMIHTSTKNQYALAYIYVAANVTSITNANITNNIGTAGCPYTTALLETVTVDTLLTQWSAQFNNWFTNLQNQLDSNQASNLQNQIDGLTYNVGSFDNYIIFPSISSGNLTVNIFTLAGANAGITNPIRFKVGNTKYSLTSGSYITKNGGSNYGNAGKAEMANQSIDWFVYAIGETGAAAGLKFGYSRIPYGTKMGHFTNVPGSDHQICGNFTNYISTDPVSLIGRFRAALSGSPTYTWSIPDALVVNRPIDSTDWMTYIPQVSTTSGVITSLNFVVGEYRVNGREFAFDHAVSINNNGTGASGLRITLPFNIVTSANATGRENNATGKMCVGLLNSGGYYCTWLTHDNQYPGGNGYMVAGGAGGLKMPHWE